MTKREPFAEQDGRGYIRILGHRYRLLEYETTGLATQRAAEINAAFDKAVAERVKEAVEEFREREKVLLSAIESIRNQCDEFRENVLNCRHQLQDWKDADMVNDVLGLFDDVVTGFDEKALPDVEEEK